MADEEEKPPYIYSRPEDVPIAILQASTRDTLYLFTAEGTAIGLPVHQLPEGNACEGEGDAVTAISRLGEEEIVAALALPPSPPPGAIFFITSQGQAKRLLPEDLPGVGLKPDTVIRLDKTDWLVDVVWVEDDEVIVGSSEGQGIRFAVSEVRTMGARAGGVIGIRLEEDDVVIGVVVPRPNVKFATITDKGAAKRSELKEISSQRRGGKGLQIAKLEKGERLMGIGLVLNSTYFIPITQRGAAKTTTGRSIPEQGRATHGDEVIALRGKDTVAGVIVPQKRMEVKEE